MTFLVMRTHHADSGADVISAGFAICQRRIPDLACWQMFDGLALQRLSAEGWDAGTCLVGDQNPPAYWQGGE